MRSLRSGDDRTDHVGECRGDLTLGLRDDLLLLELSIQGVALLRERCMFFPERSHLLHLLFGRVARCVGDQLVEFLHFEVLRGRGLSSFVFNRQRTDFQPKISDAVGESVERGLSRTCGFLCRTKSLSFELLLLPQIFQFLRTSVLHRTRQVELRPCEIHDLRELRLRQRETKLPRRVLRLEDCFHLRGFAVHVLTQKILNRQRLVHLTKLGVDTFRKLLACGFGVDQVQRLADLLPKRLHLSV